MATNLETPILNSRTRSVNFFNGRLLSGEDLTAEQQANRVAHSLLGRSIGSGVVRGLEVTTSAKLNSTQNPVLTVNKGLAVNRRGAQLLLADNTDIALVRPASATNGSTSVFQDCKPVQSGVYVAGAGVYMLTIGPASSPEGSAEVNGTGTTAASCNSDYNAYGVQFRLLQIDQLMGLTQAQLGDTNHLRNLVAYTCFGVSNWNSVWTDPLGSPVEQFGLVDTLLSNMTLIDCEVPLAALYWTADGGIDFIDMWSVRRPVLRSGAFGDRSPLVGNRRASEGIAMFLQFQLHLDDVLQSAPSQASALSIRATDNFLFLPPFGLLPLGSGQQVLGLDYTTFFADSTYRPRPPQQGPPYIEGSQFDQLVYRAMLYPPIDLSAQDMVWLYYVRENMEAIVNHNSNPVPYLVFTNGHIPYQAKSHYDLNHWDYANFV